VIAIHGTSAVAVQPQAPVVVTVAAKAPPAVDTLWASGASAYAHETVGIVGEELWPHATHAATRTMATMYRTCIATSTVRLAGRNPSKLPAMEATIPARLSCRLRADGEPRYWLLVLARIC
jgi:hypothetical protein